jgi:hypothetical protein
MSEAIQESAVRLYNKLKRHNDGMVANVGIGKAQNGNPVLVAYLREGAPMICPASFEGFGVITAVSPTKPQTARR